MDGHIWCPVLSTKASRKRHHWDEEGLREAYEQLLKELEDKEEVLLKEQEDKHVKKIEQLRKSSVVCYCMSLLQFLYVNSNVQNMLSSEALMH